MGVLGKLILGEAYRAPEHAPPSSEPIRVFGQPVGRSGDFDRVSALPRRPCLPPAEAVDRVTREFRRPESSATLRPIQAWALDEARKTDGLFAAIGVGAGKTLLSLLLPTALRSRTAVLLVPANLWEKTVEVDYPRLAHEWRLPNLAGGDLYFPDSPGILHVVAYSTLSSPKQWDVLDRIKPDLIVCDEGHALRHTSAARTKRFLRYMRAHPDTKFCVLSGTIVSRSIKDYQHLCRLALRDGSPTPHAFPVLEEWAAALDPSPFPCPPGVLSEWSGPLESVRDGWRKRLTETPGVVATTDNAVPNALVLERRDVTLPANVTLSLQELRATWCTPGGEEITDALSFSRYARQLAAGLYYRWIWPRNESLEVRKAWLAARKDWHREIREFLTHRARAGCDSPLLYEQAVVRGSVTSDSYEAWSGIRHSARPETEAVWVDPFLVTDAVAWGKEAPGIVWYEHDALGMRIAATGGFPFYGGGDKASKGLMREDGSRTVVASVRAHGEGKNLQAFCRSLVTTPSSNGKVWEQLLGRTHRAGQEADEVVYDVYLSTMEARDALRSAIRDAWFIQETLGASQKLTYLTYGFDVGERGT